MSQKIKLTTLSIVILGILLISGCSKKSGTNVIDINADKNELTQKNEKQEQGDLKNVPENLDSILDSINSESQKETETISEEENDAKKAVSDEGEAGDFGAIYNENEF